MTTAADRLSLVSGHLFQGGMFAGQTAVVTGAGQGIGAETAILFAREGARVVVADLDGAKAEDVAGRIRAAGGTAVAVAGDIMKPETVDAVVNAAVRIGGGKVHHLVNNVGSSYTGGGMRDEGLMRGE